jgi:hypothetical protein
LVFPDDDYVIEDGVMKVKEKSQLYMENTGYYNISKAIDAITSNIDY